MTTNRDKINNMTNEELAKLFNFDTPACYKCIYKNKSNKFCAKNNLCVKGIAKWLESEAEND